MHCLNVSVSLFPVQDHADVDSDLIILSCWRPQCVSLPAEQLQCMKSLRAAVQAHELYADTLNTGGASIDAARCNSTSQAVPLPLLYAASTSAAGPAPVAPVAYSFRLECARSQEVSPEGETKPQSQQTDPQAETSACQGTFLLALSWELQYRRLGPSRVAAEEDARVGWCTVDRREIDKQTADAHSKVWSKGCPVVVYLAPAAVYCHTDPVQYRLIVREVAGSSGGSMSRHVPLPSQQHALVLSDWTLFTQTQGQACAMPRQLLPRWGWELRLCGPAGQQRLRFRSQDGLCDFLTTTPLFFAHSQEYTLTLRLQLVEDESTYTVDCHRVQCSLALDGQCISLVSSTALMDGTALSPAGAPGGYNERQGYLGRASTEQGSTTVLCGSPVCSWAYASPLLSGSCGAGLLCGGQGEILGVPLVFPPTDTDQAPGQLDLGQQGPQTWLDVRNRNCSLIDCKRVPWDVDCPLGGEAKVQHLQARINRLSIQESMAADDDAALVPVPSSTASQPSITTARPRRQRCVPFRSLEHVLLWRPLGRPGAAGAATHQARAAADSPQWTAEQQVRLPDDTDLRCAVPLARRGTGCVKQAGISSTLGCDRGGISGHDGPLVIVCHDCGPAVYKEDGRAAGMKAPPSIELGKLWHGLPEIAVMPASTHSADQRSCRTSAVPAATLQQDLQGDSSSGSAGTVNVGHCYTFEHWSSIDVFVYFGHDRVSIPPPGWIAAAHRNGVRILATLIFEWRDGELGIETMLAPYLQAVGTGTPAKAVLAQQLARIAAYYGFDGYLVNVEAHASALTATAPAHSACPIDADEHYTNSINRGVHPSSAAVVAFLADLTREMHGALPADHGLVLWYDSIDAHSGRVSWRNGLDACNRPFMEACDGLFVNYHYSEEKLQSTARAAACASGSTSSTPAQSSCAAPVMDTVTREFPIAGDAQAAAAASPSLSRSRDVFIGCDVWGRGTYGGGQWETYKAARAVAHASAQAGATLSFAVFGPAWTYEACGGASSLSLQRSLDDKLWAGRLLDSDESAGHDDTAAIPRPVVINPDGLLLTPTQKQTLGSSPATAAALTGWSMGLNGGQGWEVHEEDGKDWAHREGQTQLPGVCAPITCFVTSHSWCSASQTVYWPAEAWPDGSTDTDTTDELVKGIPHGATWPFSVQVTEWYRGTGPKFEDLYRLSAYLIDASGQAVSFPATRPPPIAAADAAGATEPRVASAACASGEITDLSTGDLVCSSRWQRASLVFPSVPRSAVGVRVTHAGKDVEYWAGHFGARMRGMHVSLLPPAASAGLSVPSASTIQAPLQDCGGLATCPGVRVDTAALSPHLFDAVRPAICALPFSTTFNTGMGAAVWREGQLEDAFPWTSHGKVDVLPSYQGPLATLGLCEGAPLAFAHDAAWKGGTALHIRLPGTLLVGSTAMVRLFCACVALPDCLPQAGALRLQARLVYCVPALSQAQILEAVQVEPVLVAAAAQSDPTQSAYDASPMCLTPSASAGRTTTCKGENIRGQPLLWQDQAFQFDFGHSSTTQEQDYSTPAAVAPSVSSTSLVQPGRRCMGLREVRLALTLLQPLDTQSIDVLIGAFYLAAA